MAAFYLFSYQWILVVICALGYIETAYGYSGYSSYGSSSNTNSRLTKLEGKMDVLINEVSRLADSSSSASDTEAASLEPVTLVSVERTPGADGNIFTLTFTKNVQELYYIVSYDENKIVDSGVKTDDGPASLSFTCGGGCQDQPSVDVLFNNKSQSFQVKLQLNNTGTRVLFQDHFTVPTIEIEHAGDLIYNSGRDVKVKITVPYGEEKGFSDVSVQLAVVKEDGTSLNNYNYGRSINDFVDETHRNFLKTRESVITISTSDLDFNVSGFLELNLAFRDPEPFLVDTIQVKRSLIVRLRNQTGPYPNGFLSMRGERRSYYGSSAYMNCKIDSSCTYSCTAYGKITDMQVGQRQDQYNYWLDQDDDDWEPLENISVMDFDFSRRVEWTVHPTVDTPDTVFRCVAFTDSKNTSVITEVHYQSQEFYIDGNRTSIVVEVDETQPDMRRARINCTIVGRPVKHVHFVLRYNDPEDDSDYYYHQIREQYLSPPIEPAGLGESVATTTVDFVPSQNSLERFAGSTCFASSNMQRYAEYNITWNPISPVE